MDMRTINYECFKGKTVIVTGGSQGVGKGISKAFLENGANVVIADINDDISFDLKDMACGDLCFKKTDLTIQDDIKDLIKFVFERFGGMDILVNNARPKFKNNEDGSHKSFLSGWDQGMDVLLKAPVQLAEYAFPYLKKSNSACIVSIGSTNANYVSSQPLVYHVAKSGLVQMTRYLAQKMGKNGIRVNCVSPGLINFQDENRSLFKSNLNKKIIKSLVPLGRGCFVQEIADTVLYLCSNSSTYITGQVLVLDGGMVTGDHFEVIKNTIEGGVWE